MAGRKVREVLCVRTTKEDKEQFPGRIVHNILRPGMEHTCLISTDGKGSCGVDFYEDNGEYCRWCCQILKFD